MSRTRTILQITSSWSISGGTRQALTLSRGLAEAGHRVVFCAPVGARVLDWVREAGLEYREFATGNFFTQWKSSRRVRAYVDEIGADVVHAHHTAAHNVALLASFGGRFPPVVANRGVLFAPHFRAKFRSRRIAAIITNSRAVKGVLEKGGINGDKIHVIYNACESPELAAVEERASGLREPLGLSATAPVVGTVGGGRPEKGFEFLVEAAPRILERFPSAVFVLVGSGTERFRPRLRKLGLEDRFRLTGYRLDALDIMALFDVFVIPSVGMESCPNVLLEAMAVALPAVGADTGGIGEIIVPGETGWVVPPGDSDAIASAVGRLLTNPERAREMGRAGRDRIVNHFSLDNKVRSTMAVYDAVCGMPANQGN